MVATQPGLVGNRLARKEDPDRVPRQPGALFEPCGRRQRRSGERDIEAGIAQHVTPCSQHRRWSPTELTCDATQKRDPFRTRLDQSERRVTPEVAKKNRQRKPGSAATTAHVDDLVRRASQLALSACQHSGIDNAQLEQLLKTSGRDEVDPGSPSGDLLDVEGQLCCGRSRQLATKVLLCQIHNLVPHDLGRDPREQ